MKIYQLEGKNAIVHDGRLYLEVEETKLPEIKLEISDPVLTSGQVDSGVEKKIAIIPKKLEKKSKSSKRHGRGKRLGTEAKELLLNEIADGKKPVPELALEYEISQSYIYNLKKYPKPVKETSVARFTTKNLSEAAVDKNTIKPLNFNCVCGKGFQRRPVTDIVKCPDCGEELLAADGREI